MALFMIKSKLLLFLISAILISGCYSAKKAARQINKAALNYPEVVSKIARDYYPCDTSNSATDTIIQDSLIYVECPDNDTVTIQLPSNTIYPQIGKKKIGVWVKVPVYRYYITLKVRDMAAEKMLQVEIEKITVKLEKSQGKSDSNSNWIKWLLISCGVLTTGIVLLFKLK